MAALHSDHLRQASLYTCNVYTIADTIFQGDVVLKDNVPVGEEDDNTLPPHLRMTQNMR